MHTCVCGGSLTGSKNRRTGVATFDQLMMRPEIVVPFVAAGPFAIACDEAFHSHWLGAGLFGVITLLTAVAVAKLYDFAGRAATSPRFLTRLYWLSLPVNVALVVLLGNHFSIVWTLAAFGLFISSFFAGMQSKQ
jgi:hypothetical protein